MKKRAVALTTTLLLCSLLSLTANAAWNHDENGWQYEDDNGLCQTNSWLQDQGIWYHFDENGYMQSGWFLEGSTWYYLDPVSGAMAADIKQTIDQQDYYFDASGALSDASITQIQNTYGSPRSGTLKGRSFENSWSNYSMTLPSGCDPYDTYYDSIFDNDLKDVTFHLRDGYANVQIVYHNMSETVTDELLQQYIDYYKSKMSNLLVLQNSRSLYLGDYKFRSCEYTIDSHLFWNTYFRPVDNYIMVIQVLSYNMMEKDINQMLGSIKKIQ